MVSKKLYHEYKNAGKCVMCGNERGESTSSVRCQVCHDKFNESRFKRLNKRKEAALCLQCGTDPSVGNSNYCIECRRKNADIKRKLSNKKILALLPHFQFTALEDGISRVWQTMQHQRKGISKI